MKNASPNHLTHRVRGIFMGLFLLVGISNSTFAQFTVWNNPGITNSFTYAAGWNEGIVTNTVPNGIEAYLFNGGITVSAGESFTPSQLTMGWDAGQASTYTQSGGNASTSGQTCVGRAGTNVFTMSGGTYSCGDLMVGWPGPFSNGQGATGTLNQTGGSFETRAVAYIGLLTGGTGSLNVSGGTNTTGRMLVGWNAGGNGTINLSGGDKVVRETTFVGFDGGTGTLNISGGTYTATGTAGLFVPGENFGSFRIADFGNNSGTVNLSGTGVVNAAQYTAVGGWGNGTLNITGGTWNQATGGIVVGDAANLNWTGSGLVNQSGGTVNADWVFLQKGTYNLNGGVVAAFGVADTKAEKIGVFNFNGGTLRARTNNANFITADTVEIKSGGAIIDTQTNNVTIAEDLSGAGGLTKRGSGWLTLSGSNNYAGATVIEEGLLDIYVSNGVTQSYGGGIMGSGSLNKSGAGTLQLAGTNSYAGFTTVGEGKLVVSGAIVSTNNNAYVIVETAGPDAPEIEVVDGATLQCVGPLGLGWQDNTSGKLTQSGGLVHVTRGNLVLADSAGSTGTLEVTGGSTMVASNSFVGRMGTGTLTLGGGAFQGSGVLSLGLTAGASGSVNITGGTHSVARTCFVGEAGSGTLEISGGVLNAGTDALGSFRIADSEGSSGVGIMNLSGSGVVNAPSYTLVGGLGTGTLNISGGTWNSPDDIVLGDRPPEVTDWTGTGVVNQTGGAVNARAVFLQAGTYNLKGGVLAVAAVGDTKLEAVGVFNFDGGTLQATGNHDDFLMADTVEIKSGGAIIDTQTNNVTIAKGLSGAGGLTKKGAGILTLAGANTYSGATKVEAGTLRIQAVNFTADTTATTLTVAFAAAPADGQLAIFPGALNGNPTVSFTGLAAGQTGVFSPLSGKVTFTTTSTGVSFSSWSGGQTLTPDLLGKYAIGGASGPSASSVRPVLTSTGGGVTLSALVRTNSDAGSFAVIGEYSTNLASWSPLTNNPAGTPSANTNGVPEGFQRKDFTVPSGAPKMFLRLKSSL